MSLTAVETIPDAYDVVHAGEIPRLHGYLYDLIHCSTGARHVHLSVPDRNSYFCALHRTPPPDSTGVPHIMEHCVSGGSRRFPPGAGGDMYTRSLLTDINGTTHSDFTTFYVASRNHTDYLNWLEYIVDVTLFPRMEEDTFLRHRGHFEFETPDDPTTPLRFVGTVFNEMKATFGNPLRHATKAMNRALFPGHPYAEDAGGDPAVMPQLTYDGLMSFFNAFYHPGNATYISRGDIPLGLVLERVQEIVGDHRARRPPTEIPDIDPLPAPVVAEAPTPAAENALGQVALGWTTRAECGDSYARLVFDLATELAFETESSPVRRALDAAGVSSGTVRALRAPFRRGTVQLYLADTDPANAQQVESIVLDAIDEIVRRGFSKRDIEDAIARYELRRRDQVNALPTFLDTVIPPVLYGGDTSSAIELEDDLARLRNDLTSNVLEGFLGANILENQHRARVTLHPDVGLERRVAETEQRWLDEERLRLDDGSITEIIATTKRLGSPATHDFPKRGLKLEEGLTELTDAVGIPVPDSAVPITLFDAPTDGIAHLMVSVDLTGLDAALVPYAGLFAAALERRARERAPRVHGVKVRTHARITADGRDPVYWLELSGRALARDIADLLSMVDALTHWTNPDDAATSQIALASASALEQRVMPDAQVLLRRLAAASLGPVGAFDDATRGLSHLSFLKQGPAADRLAAFTDAIATRARASAAVVGSGDGIEGLVGRLGDTFSTSRAEATGSTGDGPAVLVPRHRARVAQLPVAFTCEAHAIPPLDDADGPAIAVLAQLMFAGYLNSEIRKGGAYGVDFEPLPERGIVWMSSRRDPLPVASYAAFDEAIARFRDGRWDGPDADDGKLAILRVTDPVDTPASAARRTWIASFTGHDATAWNAYRRRALDVTDDDLHRVATTYFDNPSRATLIGRGQLEDGPVSAMFEEIEDV